MYKRILQTYAAAKREAQRSCLLVNLDIQGSTYTKPGAAALITEKSCSAGLLSGGCLEGELQKTASLSMDSSRAILKTYNMLDDDDVLWGSGSGCKGLMKVLYIPNTAVDGYFLLERLLGVTDKHSEFFLIVASPDSVETGRAYTRKELEAHPRLASLPELFPKKQHGNQTRLLSCNGWSIFHLRYTAPLRLLVLGGGADALPFLSIAQNLDWSTVLVDHREGHVMDTVYADADERFHLPDVGLGGKVNLHQADAAIIKSHHYMTDKQYLEQALNSPLPYIGLLGPRHRRDRMLDELGQDKLVLTEDRLRSPAGIRIQSYDAGAIAVAVIAEILTQFYGIHD